MSNFYYNYDGDVNVPDKFAKMGQYRAAILTKFSVMPCTVANWFDLHLVCLNYSCSCKAKRPARTL